MGVAWRLLRTFCASLSQIIGMQCNGFTVDQKVHKAFHTKSSTNLVCLLVYEYNLNLFARIKSRHHMTTVYRTPVSISKECSLKVGNFYLKRASASVPQTVQNGTRLS